MRFFFVLMLLVSAHVFSDSQTEKRSFVSGKDSKKQTNADFFKDLNQSLLPKVPKKIVSFDFPQSNPASSGTGHWTKKDKQNFEYIINYIDSLDPKKDFEILLWIFLYAKGFWEINDVALRKVVRVPNSALIKEIFQRMLFVKKKFVEWEEKFFIYLVDNTSSSEILDVLDKTIQFDTYGALTILAAKEYVKLNQVDKAVNALKSLIKSADDMVIKANAESLLSQIVSSEEVKGESVK